MKFIITLCSIFFSFRVYSINGYGGVNFLEHNFWKYNHHKSGKSDSWSHTGVFIQDVTVDAGFKIGFICAGVGLSSYSD